MNISRAVLVSGLMLGLLAAGTARAQEDREQQPMKNIKLLTGKTRKEVVAIMKLWSRDLGQKCIYCHVKNDFPSEEKKEKLKAREMLELTNGLNEKYATVEKKVTCFTCHRGAKDTVNEPPPGGAPAGQ